MNIANVTSERIKRVLIQDKLASPARLSTVLKEEIAYVLNRYMELKSNIKFSLCFDENGDIDLSIQAKAAKIYRPKN